MTVRPTAAPSIPSFAAPDLDVIVLPREVADDGIGLYDDSVVTLAKELRVEGARADYQHAPDQRTWIGERAVAEIALAFVVGIASNAGWAALRALFASRYSNDRIKGKIARCIESDGERRWEWYEMEGTGKAVEQALHALAPMPEDEP